MANPVIYLTKTEELLTRLEGEYDVSFTSLRVDKGLVGSYKLTASDRKGSIYQILRPGTETSYQLTWVTQPTTPVEPGSSYSMAVKWNKTDAKWSLVFDWGLPTQSITNFDGLNDVAVHGLLISGIDSTPDKFGNKTATLVCSATDIDVASFRVKVCDAVLPYDNYPFTGVGDLYTINTACTVSPMEWVTKLSTQNVVSNETFNIAVRWPCGTTTWTFSVSGSDYQPSGTTYKGWTVTKVTNTTATVQVDVGAIGTITIKVVDTLPTTITDLTTAPPQWLANVTSSYWNIADLVAGIVQEVATSDPTGWTKKVNKALTVTLVYTGGPEVVTGTYTVACAGVTLDTFVFTDTDSGGVHTFAGDCALLCGSGTSGNCILIGTISGTYGIDGNNYKLEYTSVKVYFNDDTVASQSIVYTSYWDPTNRVIGDHPQRWYRCYKSALVTDCILTKYWTGATSTGRNYIVDTTYNWVPNTTFNEANQIPDFRIQTS